MSISPPPPALVFIVGWNGGLSNPRKSGDVTVQNWHNPGLLKKLFDGISVCINQQTFYVWACLGPIAQSCVFLLCKVSFFSQYGLWKQLWERNDFRGLKNKSANFNNFGLGQKSIQYQEYHKCFLLDLNSPKAINLGEIQAFCFWPCPSSWRAKRHAWCRSCFPEEMK